MRNWPYIALFIGLILSFSPWIWPEFGEARTNPEDWNWALRQSTAVLKSLALGWPFLMAAWRGLNQLRKIEKTTFSLGAIWIAASLSSLSSILLFLALVCFLKNAVS